MISDRYKFIYVHVPKTGGNATQTALLPLSDDHKTVKPGQDGADRFDIAGAVTPHKHATLAEYRARLGDRLSEFHVAITIRHPFERAISLYFNPRRWQDREPVFDETLFIESMQKMVPLVDFLRLEGPIRLPDTALRFTHLQADLEALYNRLNLPGPPPLLARINRSAAAPDTRRRLLASGRLRQIATEIFTEDLAFLETIPEGRQILQGG